MWYKEGTIMIGEAVLFKVNDFQLTNSGKKTLQNIGERLKVFLNANRESTRLSIIIEGHTDKSGGDTYNMNLGALRARSVYNFFREDTKIDTETYDISIASQGEHNPVLGAEYEMRSRRIEIQIRPKFEDFIQKVWDLLKQ